MLFRSRQVREARGEVLPLSIESLVGGLEGCVRGNDVLQFLDPSGVLVGDVSLLGHLTLQRRGAAPVPADFVFGLLQEFLIPPEHPSLLPVRLEELGEVLAQTGLGGGGLFELQLQWAAVGACVARPPRRRR